MSEADALLEVAVEAARMAGSLLAERVAIGAEQRAKLLGESPDRVPDEGPEGDAQGDDALARPL